MEPTSYHPKMNKFFASNPCRSCKDRTVTCKFDNTCQHGYKEWQKSYDEEKARLLKRIKAQASYASYIVKKREKTVKDKYFYGKKGIK